MTNLEKIQEIQALVKRRAADGSHKDARTLLIEEGIYNGDGKLAPEYGGKDQAPPKRENAAA